MSTNKTQNYNLHSWLPQDEFHVTEINENFTALDAALHQEVGVLDALLQAETGSREALANSLSGSVRMVTGSYTGSATGDYDTQTPVQVTLGFKPKAVLVVATEKKITGPLVAYLAVTSSQSKPAVTLTATGFTARNEGVYANYAGGMYHYAAFY